MDSTYQQQLRDLNDLNWERFKSELHSAIAQSEGRTIEKMAQMETRLTESLTQRFSSLMKWMFIYWSGMMLPLAE